MQAAIERIYWKHRQGLYTLALAITRCPASAEDAVQEAFARLWSTRARPGGDLEAYVYAAVRNAAIDQRRRADAFVPADTASIYNGLPADPADNAVTEEQHRRVREAVDSLADDERETVILRIYGGLTFEQAAQTLGEPMPTVASRYRRALEKLSRRIRGVTDNGHE